MTNELLRIAQDIVDATSIFIRTRTINIMDISGTIIASSDRKRIGTWHEGAARVIKTGNTVEIKPEEVKSYQGAKEGINSPIVQDGSIVGVVGIYGVPDEVRDTAALLSVCVGLYLKQADRTEQEGRRKETRRMLYELLLSEGEHSSRIGQLFSKLGKELSFPYTPVLVIMKDVANRDADGFAHTLIEQKAMESRTDLVMECTAGYLLLLQDCPSISINTIASLSTVTKVVKGREIYEHTQAGSAIREMQMLSCVGEGKRLDMHDPDDLYLFNFLPDGGATIRKAAEEYKEKLSRLKSPWVAKTIEAFLSCDGNNQAITSTLGVHKNTSMYRIRKIFEQLGLEHARTESRMFFLRYAWTLHEADCPKQRDAY